MKQIVFLDTEILPSDKDWKTLTDEEVMKFANEKANQYRNFGLFFNTEKELVECYNHEELPMSDNWVAYVIGDEKDQSDRLAEFKESVLADIVSLLKEDGNRLMVFEPSRDFRLAYVDYNYNPSAEVKTLHVEDGRLMAELQWVGGDDDKEEFSGKTNFTIDSLLAMKHEVEYYIRKDRRNRILDELKAMCEENHGGLCFDGKFRFCGVAHFDDGTSYHHEECYLNSILIKDNYLVFRNTEEESLHNNMEDFIEDEELDRIIVYARKTNKIGKIRKYLDRIGSGVGNLVLQLDGSFTCDGIRDDAGNWFGDGGKLTEVYMHNGKVYVTQDRDDNENQGLLCPLENMDCETLDRFFEYFEKQKKQTFTIKVFASRTWEIPADSAEEALRMAQDDLKAHPLYDGDIDSWE